MMSIVDSMTNDGMQHGWLSSSGGWDGSDAPYGRPRRVKRRGGVAIGDGMDVVVLD